MQIAFKMQRHGPGMFFLFQLMRGLMTSLKFQLSATSQLSLVPTKAANHTF